MTVSDLGLWNSPGGRPPGGRVRRSLGASSDESRWVPDGLGPALVTKRLWAQGGGTSGLTTLSVPPCLRVTWAGRRERSWSASLGT